MSYLEFTIQSAYQESIKTPSKCYQKPCYEHFDVLESYLQFALWWHQRLSRGGFMFTARDNFYTSMPEGMQQALKAVAAVGIIAFVFGLLVGEVDKSEFKADLHHRHTASVYGRFGHFPQ